MLWQFAQLVLAPGLVGSVAAALALGICLPPRVLSLLRRARRRYQS